ncbi:MAG: GNAT family N-acetyltransferase [Candidatus Heimdallarchaeota archaeon]
MTIKPLDLTKIAIRSFIPKETSREVWQQYHQLNEELMKELHPVDALPKREVVEKEICYDSPDYNVTRWLVYKDETEKKLVGRCIYNYCKETSSIYKENKEIGFVHIMITSTYRRQGLGTKLLGEIISKLEKVGCKYFTTKSKYPSGWNFWEKTGAKLTNIMKESRLDLDSVDWTLINSWIKEGERRNPEVKIEQFYGVSEVNIEEYAEILTQLVSEMPTLEEENEKAKEIITPQRFRDYVHFLEEKTCKFFTIRSIEPDRKVSGLTEVYFSDISTPELVNQGLTGVKDIYRGKGLGKWLKAAMLCYIRENLPNAKYLITGNAEHNEPMLSINARLGFKPYREKRSYKFTIYKLKRK